MTQEKLENPIRLRLPRKTTVLITHFADVDESPSSEHLASIRFQWENRGHLGKRRAKNMVSRWIRGAIWKKVLQVTELSDVPTKTRKKMERDMIFADTAVYPEIVRKGASANDQA